GPQVLDDAIIVTWTLGVSAAGDPCLAIGEPTVVSADPPVKLLFGPLALESGGKRVEIFNPVMHGFNNEIDRLQAGLSAPAPDEGPDGRGPFQCPDCLSTTFAIQAAVWYQPGAVDLFARKPHLPIPDLFNDFNLHGVCSACGRRAVIAEFDGL